MAQRLLDIRVRPPRVTVLVNRSADQEDLRLAFEFLSRIWGGRFGQVLAVDPKTSDDLTTFRLAESRPEFIYGIGLDDEHWARATRQACQPRGYGRLRPEFVQEIEQAHAEDYILVDHALIHLFQTRYLRPHRRQTLRLVTPEPLSTWAVYCAAMFGIHHPTLRTEYYDEATSFTANTTLGFIDLATEFVKKWQHSWLDVTGHALNLRISAASALAPTVVLVQSPVPDLSLFWNLRTASDTIHPAWIIPIPVEGATDLAVLEKVREWLLAFLPYGPRPNYCLVTSQAVKERDCQRFAEEFQKCLAGSPIVWVDYEPPRNRIPEVIPCEYETTWAVDITGRTLTIQPPRPRVFEDLGSRAWFVDLLKDVKTGRAVEELQLPPSPAVFELLNGPCPPNFEHLHIPRTGDGSECINIRCSGRKEVVNVYLPTSDEILGEILREYGVEPLPDEKRSSYLPVIERFGGLFLAASAFSGQSGTILTTLAEDTKTPSEIRGAGQLGAGELAGGSYIQRVERILDHETERMKRVSRHRFLDYAKHSTPENLKVHSLLEHWADRRILTRHWKIGPCRSCNQQYFVPTLRIERRIVCTNCGHRISLPARVPIGYSLHRAARHAIKEGIIPVALTGRFLWAMTNQGFLWLPGVKYRAATRYGDIDVLASCDGRLVFCECKRLERTPPEAQVWDEIVNQFLEMATIGTRCHGSLIVLAAQVGEYPQPVQDRIKAEVGGSIPYLLLNKEDLETGYREVKGESGSHRLGFYDLLPLPFRERPRRAADKPRTIHTGWGIYSR